MKNCNICGVVLAGGLSSRMGCDKTTLRIDQKTLLENAVATLESVCNEVHISVHADSTCLENLPLPITDYNVITDTTDRIGPMGGIISALQGLNTSILVLACDMPFITPDILNKLIKHHENRPSAHVMTTFRHMQTNFIETLAAIYAPEALSLLEKSARSSIYKLSKSIPQTRRTHIPVHSHEELYFFNVNKMKDVTLARTISTSQLIMPQVTQ